jgi:hypothetical protein
VVIFAVGVVLVAMRSPGRVRTEAIGVRR